MNLRLVDTHAHPQMGEYQSDREAMIRRAFDQGIGMIVIGTTVADSLEGLRLAEQYPNDPIWAAVGVHPTDSDLGDIHPAQLAALGAGPKVVAIGECGLDYFRLEPDDMESRQLQSDVFEQHLLLAGQRNLPVIIHTRDRKDVYAAYDDVLALLTRHQVKHFVMHCYSGDWERAEQFLDLGGYLSFTGILTFPKSEMMQDVARRTPDDRIMVETDAPFLAPEPHRGKRNEPMYVRFVAEHLATLRSQSMEDIVSATTANARRLFSI